MSQRHIEHLKLMLFDQDYFGIFKYKARHGTVAVQWSDVARILFNVNVIGDWLADDLDSLGGDIEGDEEIASHFSGSTDVLRRSQDATIISPEGW